MDQLQSSTQSSNGSHRAFTICHSPTRVVPALPDVYCAIPLRIQSYTTIVHRKSTAGLLFPVNLTIPTTCTRPPFPTVDVVRTCYFRPTSSCGLMEFQPRSVCERFVSECDRLAAVLSPTAARLQTRSSRPRAVYERFISDQRFVPTPLKVKVKANG